MNRHLAGLFLLALLLSSPAHAQQTCENLAIGMMGQCSSGGAVGLSGPGDVVSGATAFWGLRAYNSAYANSNGKLINVLRASDSQTCDILAAANGGLGLTANCSGSANGTAAATFCNATTCSIVTAYDQTGNNNTMTQGTAANRPVLTFNCIGSLPCMTFNGTTQVLGTVSGPVANQPLTVSYVADRTGSTAALGAVFGGHGGSVQMGFNNSANQVFIFAGASTVTAAAADNAAHAVQNVINGSSSILNVDGTGATVSPGTFPLDGSSEQLGAEGDSAHFLPGELMEVGLWSIGFSTTQNTNMCHNQFTYWGTATSC